MVFVIGLIASIYAFSEIKNFGPTVIIISIIVLAIVFGCCQWYMSTASGRRALTDQKSELNNGIERVVKVYTADGELLAKYEGKIDIDINDGGYVKFDFDGKRYIYYNCFIETIAEIE